MTARIAANRFSIGIVICIIALFAVLSLLAPDAPGLYMDAVNPDYEVVKILHPEAPIVVWEMPGDLLFGRFPILLGLYAGSIAAYWAIPFYLIMGGTVLSIRVAHLCVGVLILIATAILTRQLTRSSILAVTVSFLLAVDPAFVFVFRTQGYVQMIGLFFLLCSMIAVHRRPNPMGLLLGGLFLGVSGYAYFVYFLALPGMLAYVVLDRNVEQRKKSIGAFFSGFVAGVFPYFLAYGSLFSTLGMQGGFAWLQSALSGLHVAGTGAAYFDRVASTVSTIRYVLTNEWQWLTFWKEAHADAGQTIKALLLVLLPLFGFLVLRRSERTWRDFAIVAFPTVSFVICATYFGSRFGGHDLTAILTLTYISSIVAVSLLLAAFANHSKPMLVGFAIIGVTIAVGNASSTIAVASHLASDGGAGLYSRSISSFPERTIASGDTTPVIFWTWGEMMPFIYETAGSIPVTTADQTTAFICRYGRAKVVLLGPDVASVSPASLVTGRGLKVEQVSPFGNDSTLPFETVSLTAARVSPGCTDSRNIASVASAAGRGVAERPSATLEPSRGSTDGLRLVATTSRRADSFISDPLVVPAQVNGELPAITVHWFVAGANTIEIHMSSPNGQLFARGGNSGTATTGSWVNSGAKFFLQDVSNGTPGRTVSLMIATPCVRCL